MLIKFMSKFVGFGLIVQTNKIQKKKEKVRNRSRSRAFIDVVVGGLALTALFFVVLVL